MAATVHLEYERKYDVAEDAVLPRLSAASALRSNESLSAVYFDTEDLALARNRIVVRRREGGSDAGWHLKTARPDGDRLELQWPLTPRDDVPEELAAQVRVHVRGRSLVPVARVLTERTIERVSDRGGRVIAELCDDRVTGTDLRSGTSRSWHEWEIELVEEATAPAKDREAALDALERVLARAGAQPASSASKLSRTLGLDGIVFPERPSLGRESRAVEVLSVILADLVDGLHRADPDARSGEAEAVHIMRSHVRRLRSVLASFSRVYPAETVNPLKAELKVLGQRLGAARDPLVLHERARNLARSQPDKPTHAIVLSRLVQEKEAEAKQAHRALVEWLDSARYFALLDALDELVRSEGVPGYADRPAHRELLRGLRHDYRRVRKATKRERAKTSPEKRVEILHEIRRAARRLRFAAEAVTEQPADLFGGQVARVARAARRVQDTLGEYRDSVLLQAALQSSSASAHAAGVSTFGYGRLHALEQLRGDTQLASYSRAAERLRAAGKRLRD